jgi:hypothetical protein
LRRVRATIVVVEEQQLLHILSVFVTLRIQHKICIRHIVICDLDRSKIFSPPSLIKAGRAVSEWLRHYATNQQVAGSIPDGVIGIFQSHNAAGPTMALGSAHPLTEMSTRCISWG